MRYSLRLLLPLATVLGVLIVFRSFPPKEEPTGPASSVTPAAADPVTPAGAPAPNPATSPALMPPPGSGVSAPRPAREGAQRVPTQSDGPSTPGPLNTAPLPRDFMSRMVDASGKRVRFALPDGGTAAGTVELLRSDAQGVLSVQGRLESPTAGTYFFQRQTAPGVAGAMVGHVRFDEGVLAWRVDPTGPDGAPQLNAVKLDQVICIGKPMPGAPGDPLPKAEAASGSAESSDPAPTPGSPQYVPQTHPTNMTIPAVLNGVVPLESLPDAAGVIYLDFDGEPGPFSGWGGITGDAAPSGATTAQIKEVWQRVAEDYQAFNLNVTTDRRVYDRAAETSRQHVVITPTTDAAPSAGGVAFIGSFNWSGNTVCWSFIRTGKSAAEAISHEVGHTLGLGHDGRSTPSEDYYGGHGSGDVGWAPIMGVGYSQNLSQWSRGEYTGANNSEDDLAIITNNNNTVDYRVDDTTATYATADYLDILSNFTVSNEGIIETRADVDAWRFQTTGGSVALILTPVNAGPDVDLLAEIYNSDNTLIASNNPDTGLGATVTTTLASGNYTLRVSGVGRGSASADGYSDYASLGAYLISGSVTNGVRHDRFTLAENSPTGTTAGTIAARLAHGTNPVSYSITGGNTSGAFSINPSTGLLSVANPTALNYETLSTRWDDPANFQLFVSITDSINPALNESLRVVVMVSPINEPPVLTGGAVTMFTRTRTGTPVFTATGSDPDRFDFPLFSILSGNTGNAFAINTTTGHLSTTATFPVTLPPSPYSLIIRATDRGSPALTSDVTVTVALLEAPAGYTPGGLMKSYFEGITGDDIVNLTSNAKFPGAPDSEELQTVFDEVSHGDNYGSTARGYLIPPATGSYTFWIASDDDSELRISPNATPGSAVVRASAAGATGRYEYTRYATQQSVALILTAGQAYYFEARHKEGGGGDHLTVAWQGPGFTRRVISGMHLAPYQQNYAPQIAAQSFPVRRGSDFGTPLGTVSGTEVNPGDALRSFTITGGSASSWCAIDANTGLLYINNVPGLNAASGATYNLTVRVNDNASPSLSGTGTITLNMIAATAVQATGIVQQIWTGISGNAVSFLTSSPLYPHSPASTRVLSGFDTGADYNENYGSRIRAWVIPPTTGTYNFYVAGDDETQLRFTTGTSYATAPVIASVATSTARNTWVGSPGTELEFAL